MYRTSQKKNGVANLQYFTNVLRSNRINRKSAALIARYSQKKECSSFVFYCFKNLSIVIRTLAQELWNHQSGFQAKSTSLKEDFNQIENWKCHMFDFRLILLDRITNGAIINVIFWDMINTTFIQVCVKFQFNITKVTKVTATRGMMGQKRLGWLILLCVNLSLVGY